MLYNLFVEVPDKNRLVPLDRWTKCDLLAAAATLVGFPLILSMTPDQLADKDVKGYLDDMYIFIIVVQWARFYAFFFMISELSKMILTFSSMIIGTMSFMFLVAAYLILVSAIFTTLF